MDLKNRRKLWRLFPVMVGLLVSLSAFASYDDRGFNPSPNRTMRVMAQQADGKLLVGGDFTIIGGFVRNRIARLNIDGSVDRSFDAGVGPNSSVRSIAIQSDGKILIGGSFTHFLGEPRNHIARLTSTGSLDVSFQTSINGTVNKIAVLSDGHILVAGSFNSIGGVDSSRIARLTPGGQKDARFDAGEIDGAIYALNAHEDGSILIGGRFAHVQGSQYSRLARLGSNGQVDDTFTPVLNGTVRTIARELDGRILVGGEFTTINQTQVSPVSRLFIDGTLDRGFVVNLSGIAYSVLRLNDGTWAVGGAFNQGKNLHVLSGETGASIVYAEGHTNSIYGLLQQGDGKLLIGGRFELDYSLHGAHGQMKRLARYYISIRKSELFLDFGAKDAISGGVVLGAASLPDGSSILAGNFDQGDLGGAGWPIALEFHPNGVINYGSGLHEKLFKLDSSLYAVTMDDQERLYVAGDFIGLKLNEGFPIRRIVRMSLTGDVDPSFIAGFADGTIVSSIVPLPGNKLLVGGDFSHIEQAQRRGIARLMENGQLDLSFRNSLNLNSDVKTIALQSDGKILVGGNLFIGNPLPGIRKQLVRLLPGGNIDPTFNTGAQGFNGAVETVVTTPYDKILVGGYFDQLNEIQVGPIVALSESGARDVSFAPEAITSIDGNTSVLSIATQADGHLFIGGHFTTIEGFRRTNLARLNYDGSLDRGYNPSPDNTVVSLMLHLDGSLSISGDFSDDYNNHARLRSIVATMQKLSLSEDGQQLLWNYQGGGPEVTDVRFEISDDKTNWRTLGRGAAVPVGWAANGLNIPHDEYKYIRVTAKHSSGFRNGSFSKPVSNIWQIYRAKLTVSEECTFFIIPIPDKGAVSICL